MQAKLGAEGLVGGVVLEDREFRLEEREQVVEGFRVAGMGSAREEEQVPFLVVREALEEFEAVLEAGAGGDA